MQLNFQVKESWVKYLPLLLYGIRMQGLRKYSVSLNLIVIKMNNNDLALNYIYRNILHAEYYY